MISAVKSCKNTIENSCIHFTQHPLINTLYSHRTIINIKPWTLVQYYSLKYRLYSDFTNSSMNVLLPSQDPILIPTRLSLTCLLHLLPSGTVPHSFSLSFMILTLLKSTGELFCRIAFSSGLSVVFCYYTEAILGKDTAEVMYFSQGISDYFDRYYWKH